MTLVVARKINDTVWIISDTLLSDPRPDHEREFCLKLLVIDPDTIAAYTGSPEHAHGIMKSIAENASSEKQDDPATILASEQKKFFDAHGRAEIDFIVVQKGNISKISDGKSEKVDAAWLGDHNAFESFQHYCGAFQSGLATPFSELFDPNGGAQSRADLRIVNVDSIPGCSENEIPEGFMFHDAMQLVIGNLSLPSVGGQVTVATSSLRGTRYLSFTGANSPIFEPSADGWKTVDFGDAVRGGYAFTTVVPEQAGVGGWGIFYHQGRKGHYFATDLLKQDFCHTAAGANNAEEFCTLIEGEVGYKVRHCGSFGNSTKAAPQTE